MTRTDLTTERLMGLGNQLYSWAMLCFTCNADSFARFTLADFSVPTKSASIRPDKIRMCKRLLMIVGVLYCLQ